MKFKIKKEKRRKNVLHRKNGGEMLTGYTFHVGSIYRADCMIASCMATHFFRAIRKRDSIMRFPASDFSSSINLSSTNIHTLSIFLNFIIEIAKLLKLFSFSFEETLS
jgi:hypothetical protein